MKKRIWCHCFGNKFWLSCCRDGPLSVSNNCARTIIDGDETVFERGPLERAAKEGNLMSYRHEGYWQCMDTILEKNKLEALVAKKKAPWMAWEK